MCVTTLSAQLSKTRIGVWDILHPEHGYRHVMAYQNTVKSLVDRPNCMLLQIPTSQALVPEDIIHTENDVELLMEMEKVSFPATRSFAAPNHVIQMGVYHIALLNDCSESALKEALEKIPLEKRPDISTDYLNFYAELFPGFPLLLCCFNNQDRLSASPVMIHFNPTHPDHFLFNTLDSHGGLPDLNESIKYHQTIITGSYRIQKEEYGFKAFDYKNVSEELLPWLPKYGAAYKIKETLPNRDLILSTRAFESDELINFEFGILNKEGLRKLGRMNY